MEVKQTTSWCCWPFSLCCGETTENTGEKRLLNPHDTNDGRRTPEPQRMNTGSTTPKAGGTPTKTTVVQEHRGQVSTDDFV